MSSKVLDPAKAAALDLLAAGVDAVLAAGVSPVDSRPSGGAAAFWAGRIGGCHLERIAAAHANPRVRVAVIANDAAFAKQAEAVGYRLFQLMVTNWVNQWTRTGPGTATSAATTTGTSSSSRTSTPARCSTVGAPRCRAAR